MKYDADMYVAISLNSRPFVAHMVCRQTNETICDQVVNGHTYKQLAKYARIKV